MVRISAIHVQGNPAKQSKAEIDEENTDMDRSHQMGGDSAHILGHPVPTS